MHSRNKFTPGVFVILTLLLIAALSLFMPFIDLDISIINLIFGKTDGEKSILSAFNIYGFFCNFDGCPASFDYVFGQPFFYGQDKKIFD